MQKSFLFIAYLFIHACSPAQQYPFVHYTPKDGLVSNRVRNIYQDSKGRMYFITLNGLSVYDGERFTNYTAEEGLLNEVVNCVMEMGEDSVWVVTNTTGINCIVNGKLKTLSLKNSPVVNYLRRDDLGKLYAGADDGLFEFHDNGFVKLPVSGPLGENLSNYITCVIPKGRYLVLLRDVELSGRHTLYLYDYLQKKVIPQDQIPRVISIAETSTGIIWLSTQNGIFEVDPAKLKNGKIVLGGLPQPFKRFSNRTGLIFFDADDNLWLSDGGSVIKCDRRGNCTNYSPSSGLGASAVGFIFQDKEGITWMAGNGSGVDKLMHTNLSMTEKPFGLSSVLNMFLSPAGNEVILYSSADKKMARITEKGDAGVLPVAGVEAYYQLFETKNGFFGIGKKKVYALPAKISSGIPRLLFNDTSENALGHVIADRFGNLLIAGQKYLTAIIGNRIFQAPVAYLSDEITTDNDGNIWLATRTDDLVSYSIHPENPSAYLQQRFHFTAELKGLAPRSITIDQNDRIWIGTRFKGIFVFKIIREKPELLFHFSSVTGLSENFVSYLEHDDDGNIWACTPSGLDKISMQNGKPVIENLTRQNNIYHNIIRVVIDKNKTVWALALGGLVKIVPEEHTSLNYTPRLMFTQVRAGTDTLYNTNRNSFTHTQNNLSFYFAAPSFLDENRISYSYRLQGSSNKDWSEPSSTASVSFVDLKPGHYTLDIRASFPAGRYAPQTLSYSFHISPPWWQTWWFRSIASLLVLGALMISVRFYYRRKLEKQKVILEKKQAVEKERTRIATDMHDDLGAGLSRIKFLSETIGFKIQQHQPFDEEITRIREYSHEMIDKMGEIVWALNEKNDSLIDLISYTRAYAVEYLSQNGIRCRVDIPDILLPCFVSGELRRNVYLIVKEALHNVVKHSQSTDVVIRINTGGTLDVSINDNGVGFNKQNIRPFSNGLSNMEKRIKEIAGHFEIANEKGTTVRFTVPLPG